MPKRKPSLKLATWGQRFWAWLIDVLIVGAATAAVIPSMWLGGSVLLFLYWTLLEGNGGQSVGKMAMKIRAVKSSGKRMELVDAAVSSFGKSFLLPLDMIVGLILFAEPRQRLFNMVSKTSVVRE